MRKVEINQEWRHMNYDYIYVIKPGKIPRNDSHYFETTIDCYLNNQFQNATYIITGENDFPKYQSNWTYITTSYPCEKCDKLCGQKCKI